jgi:DNA processing protein
MNDCDPRLTALVVARITGPLGRACREEIRRGLPLTAPHLLAEQVPSCAKYLDGRALIEAEITIRRWESEGIIPIAFSSSDYPHTLRNHPEAPLLFYGRGDVLSALSASEKTLAIAIVGSRNASPRGCEMAKQFASELRDYGACIISGLALGIDGAAHAGALQIEGRGSCPTIAVLGNGLHVVYPASHRRLARRILDEGGVLVSAYEPGTPPLPHHFLERNGIIAYLSRAVIVVQAAIRSGALSTVRWALDAGAEVMAVPGAVGDDRHSGTHAMIKQGAHLVTSVDDIVTILGLTPRPATTSRAPIPPAVAEAFKKGDGTVHRDALVGTEGPLTAADLIAFECQGLLTLLPGNLVQLAPSVSNCLSRITIRPPKPPPL